MKKLPDFFSGDGEFVNHKSGIYAVVNPVDEIYIGQSTDIPLRVRNYKKAILTSGKLKTSIFVHGRKNHRFFLVEDLPDASRSMLWDRERYYIKKVKDLGFTMLNLNNGGGGSATALRTAAEVSSINKNLFYSKTKSV